MRYRCTKCGSKCTLSLPKHIIPKTCPVNSEHEASWVIASEAVDNPRSSRIKQAMMRDARGISVTRIDPDDKSNNRFYRSITDAAEDNGISKGSISRSIKSKGKLKGGAYYWQSASLSEVDLSIRMAALNGVEEYRQALRQYAPERYQEIFGEE